jgi:hypothetical protein
MQPKPLLGVLRHIKRSIFLVGLGCKGTLLFLILASGVKLTILLLLD